jgi:phosphopentomutase
MKQRRINTKRTNQSKVVAIKTSFMELIQELSKLTQDDSLIIGAIKDIFRTYNVVATRTVAPVKLVAAARPVRDKFSRRRFGCA